MEQSTWPLIWSDEFDGAGGASVNRAFWSFDLGDGCAAGICGWGNNEKQSYSDAPENVSLNGEGQLAIVARLAPDGLNCYYGACRYTSAKLKTQAKFEHRYGRVEACLKLPRGQGLWPAFWLLGSSHPATPWPACGEIDVMEYRGSQPDMMVSALHGPGYSGNTPITHSYRLPAGAFSDDFHIFAVEWEAERFRFWVDDVLHYTATKADVEQHGAWVFDQPFYLILNLAVGGNFDGDPASDSIFPATMLVDYVRVYAAST